MMRNVVRACIVALSLVSSLAMAQAYPSKPVKIVIGFGPGSGTDIVARLLAEEFQKMLGQPFIVENKPGAAAQIAANQVKAAPPDGYTLLLTSNTTHSVNPHIFKKLQYDPIADFTPIGGVGYFPFILAVDAKLPVKTPQELVAWAKANKGNVFYAYGTPTVQIPAEAINKIEKLEATGVPYKSSPDAMTDVIGGRAQFMVVDLASSQPQVKAGRLRALAVAGPQRAPGLPDVPTLEEAGVAGIDVAQWYAVFAPAGTPKAIVERLNEALNQVLADRDVVRRMEDNGASVEASTPAQLRELVASELDKWRGVVARAGLGRR